MNIAVIINDEEYVWSSRLTEEHGGINHTIYEVSVTVSICDELLLIRPLYLKCRNEEGDLVAASSGSHGKWVVLEASGPSASSQAKRYVRANATFYRDGLGEKALPELLLSLIVIQQLQWRLGRNNADIGESLDGLSISTAAEGGLVAGMIAGLAGCVLQ